MWTISFSYRELILSMYCSHRSALFPFMPFAPWCWHSGARVSQVNLASHYISESHPHNCRHLVRGHIQLNMLSCGQVTSQFSGGTSRFCGRRWLRLQGEEQVLSGQNESRLPWSETFLTWLLYCCATLIISAIGCSPALSIAGSLKRHCTERVNCCKPKFLVEQSQGSSTAAIPQSWAARSRKTWGQQRLSQFVCWHEGR